MPSFKISPWRLCDEAGVSKETLPIEHRNNVQHKLKRGAKTCGTAGPCCPLLPVELGHNEGLCGRVNPRSTVRGTRGAPLLTPLLRGPGQRGCFALSPSHLSPLQMSGLEHSWRKTPCEPARSCGGEHRAAQKLPCSPATRRLGSASPPHRRWKTQLQALPCHPSGTKCSRVKET